MESDCRVDRRPDSVTPLLSGSGTQSKRKLLQVSAAIAAGVAAAFAVMLLMTGTIEFHQSSTLMQTSNDLVQDWVVPKANKNVRPNPKIVKKIKKQLRSRIQHLAFSDPPKGSGWHFFVKKKPFDTGAYTGPPRVRSCGIDSLVLQSNLVYGGWQECGYIISSGPNGEAQQGDLDSTLGYGVISAPPNTTDCTPDKMGEEPCKTIFTRTLARNHKNLLKACLANIRGISQTCNTFDRCGPHFSIPAGRSSGDSDDNVQYKSVCHSSKVGYFKEPEIQRMCGICDMFRATMGNDFSSPDAGFKKDTYKGAAGRTMPWGWHLLAAAAGLWLLAAPSHRA